MIETKVSSVATRVCKIYRNKSR